MGGRRSWNPRQRSTNRPFTTENKFSERMEIIGKLGEENIRNGICGMPEFGRCGALDSGGGTSGGSLLGGVIDIFEWGPGGGLEIAKRFTGPIVREIGRL